ncbi:alpha/beta hydrolase-fold protein [Pricia sp. S334]|uniref:Alpha/beta hydrolase-fold protein n=1 Tax=Pricia mediterranea TaxID=3076079 RepID=A0ABU3L4V2_9FLAO|nr:alpha/beta hydrolase-fold protein [Pricia sp. S334]MDT7828776.1 alpha/beta hydrolase-fold protein [Pricia sp. S334]
MQFQFDFISAKGRFVSKHLDRIVSFRFMAPANYWETDLKFPVLLMNDGQDFTAMKLEKTFSEAYTLNSIRPFVYIGLECNQNRMHEYGTASSADFKGRGGRALEYSRFVIEEFIPFLKKDFKVSSEGMDWVYCGMSLGGLSAFDIGFRHSDIFGKIGVFSGSFWWRKKAYAKKDVADRSRILLDVIKNAKKAPHLKFWLQTGTQDEKADRNNNGVIDSIDDTLDVIKELRAKGYSYPGDITYVEIKGGKHDLPTWGKVFPQFVLWAFGKA